MSKSKPRPAPKKLVISVRDEVVQRVQNQSADHEGRELFYLLYHGNIQPTATGISRIMDIPATTVVEKLARALRTPSRIGKSENGYTDIEIRKKG